MNQPVRAARVAVVAGLLAALFVVVLYLVKPVPGWAVAMFGGPGRPIDRYGGLSLTFRPDAGQEAAFDRYVAGSGHVARGEGGLVVVDFPGLAEDAAMKTVDLLTHGGLLMKEVVDGTDYAKQIGETEDVKLEVDQWSSEDGGASRTDLYLLANSAEAMQAAVAGYQPPPGMELAYEWIDPPPHVKDAQPLVRSYLVKSEVAIDGALIANAVPSYDPYTNRPVVLLEFTDEGAAKFAELTARITGGKLATIVGGRIRSAPIVNSAIKGGRATITMGGGDPMQQEHERDALVAVLRTGSLPAGTIEHQQWKPAADVTSAEWKARGLFGAIAGIVFGALVLLVLRLTRPVERRIDRPVGPIAWRRLAVTALGPLALFVGSWFTLPGVNYVELEHMTRGSVPDSFTVIALGITPVITAYLLVELVALAVPRLRWRRHDPKGRIGLGKAVAALAIALSLFQGYLVASYLESLSRGALVTPGLQFQLLVMLSLTAATMLLVIIAGLIREHGLGNGYAVLMTSSFVFEAVGPYTVEGYENAHNFVTISTLLGIAGAIGIAFATRAMLRWRIDGLRMPTSGIAPLNDGSGIVTLIIMLATLGLEDLLGVYDRIMSIRASFTWTVVILLVSVPLWAWIFARPKLVDGGTSGGWLRATGVTFLLVGVCGVVGIYTRSDQAAFAIVTPVGVMVATATLLDIVDELRARRRKLVPAGIVHQAQYIGILERILDEADIPAHFHAGHVRTLFAFFGPWAPIIVLVPEEHVVTAREKIFAAITKEHHEVVRAFVRDARPTPAPRFVPASARTS